MNWQWNLATESADSAGLKQAPASLEGVYCSHLLWMPMPDRHTSSTPPHCCHLLPQVTLHHWVSESPFTRNPKGFQPLWRQLVSNFTSRYWLSFAALHVSPLIKETDLDLNILEMPQQRNSKPQSFVLKSLPISFLLSIFTLIFSFGKKSYDKKLWKVKRAC